MDSFFSSRGINIHYNEERKVLIMANYEMEIKERMNKELARKERLDELLNGIKKENEERKIVIDDIDENDKNEEFDSIEFASSILL